MSTQGEGGVSWDDQRVFLAVIELGSLSAAARRLGLSQPTVRARLEALEASLGTALFTRSSQGLLPTGQARALQAHARAMDHASRAFLRAASAQPDAEGVASGTVRLSVADMVGVAVLPRMLAGLREQHPRLAIEVELSNTSADITQQAADIAVRMVAPSQDVLVARKVGGIALGLFAHRSYIARRGMPATVEDLAEHDFIGPDRSQADRALLGVLPPAVAARLTVRTDSHPAVAAYVHAGLGIGVTHRALGLADPGLVEVLPDAVARAVPVLPVWLVTHRDLRHEPRVRLAYDHLAEAFTDYCRQGVVV